MKRHLLVLAGGALGAASRFLLALWIAPQAHFPFSILLINVSGSFVLGFLLPYATASGLDPDLRIGLATGFVGAYTTFSTWELGTANLWAAGATAAAWVYLLGSLFLGLAAAAGGTALARRLSSGG